MINLLDMVQIDIREIFLNMYCMQIAIEKTCNFLYQSISWDRWYPSVRCTLISESGGLAKPRVLVEPEFVLLQENEVPEQRMICMTVGDSRLTKVVEHAFYDFFSIDTEWAFCRFDRHVLYSEDVHILILKSKILREHIGEWFCWAEDWQRCLRIISVDWGHIDNCRFCASLLHVWSQESAHEDHREAVCIDCMEQLLVTALVELFTLRVPLLDVVD